MVSSTSSKKNRQDEQGNRPHQFWSHPAYYYHSRPSAAAAEVQGEEARHEESLLAHQQYGHHPPHHHGHQEGYPAAAAANNRVRRSMIPWSPGQLQAYRNYDGYAAMIDEQDGNRDGEEDEEEEEEEGCCRSWFSSRRCCCCGRGTGGCRRRSSSSSPYSANNSSREEQFHHRQNSFGDNGGSSSSSGYCMKILYLLVSTATIGGLYYFTSRFSHKKWTMNPGESRRVSTAGFLTDSVKVVQTSSSTSHNQQYNYNYNNRTDNETISLGMAVYALGHNDCPPLTGPPVILEAPPEEVVLLHNAFEYQYFYLNKGSTMQVTVHQNKGATNILVLRGNKVLARIQEKKKKPMYKEYGQDVFSDFELEETYSIEQVVMERVSWTNAPIQFSFTSPASDVYILMYDNAASNEPAAFNVSYHLVLTTYNLEGLAPWCSHSAPVDPSSSSSYSSSSFSCPPLHAAEAGCIIVEAIENRGDDSHNNSSTLDRVYLVGEGGVTVTIETTRQWVYMGTTGVIPSVVLALTCWYRRRNKRRRLRRRRQRRDRAPHYDPVPHANRPQNEHEVIYQYLPPHHQQEGTTSDGAEQLEADQNEENEDIPRGRHNRNHSTNSFIGRSRPSRAEAVIDGQETPDAIIPVVVVKDDEAITSS